MPAQLIERFPFPVRFGGNDALVFLQGDGAFLLVAHGWPLPFRDEWPRQPVHVHAEVMQPAQKDICGHRAVLQHFQKQFARRLNDDARQQRNKRLVLRRRVPAFLVLGEFGAGEAFDGVLPGAGGNAFVAAGEIRLGDLQIEHGLAFGVVLGLDDLPGVVLAGCAQAGAFAGGFIHAIELVAPDAPAD